ncbi:sensor histidine kinase [Homoserinibacter sp. YIM 151385]|uniref:sensor histidine kinase n=1 Tax=Homoserinibacter sp. YIM 151385 TaxID=2985506 RepID=UPI0022F027B1|nr:histidine kinase [Homoserinibacter sp. YIM 151385]WBU38405.1 histidine kinase [Homoserinibacter sp. YIM 151385]
MLRALTTRQLVADAVIAGVVFLAFLVWVLVLGIVPGLLVLVLYSAAVFFRRLQPGIGLAIAWAASLLHMAAQLDPNPINLLVLGVLYATARHGSRLVRWLGFASAFVAAAFIAAYVVLVPAVIEYLGGGGGSILLQRVTLGAFLFGAALAGFLLCWTAGLLVGTWQVARASAAAREDAEREVVAEQERTRIARDMHDVVAHSLAVVIAQADGARYLKGKDPAALDGALDTIGSTAREALADVRVLLGQLRHSQGSAPQPVIADLERLYAQLRAAGLDVREERSGEPHPLGTSPQLAVYRIVQEALTNALRHGDTAEPVLIRFDWAPGGLHLSISNAVGAPRSGPIPGTGHGVAGMTERALIVGGRLDAVRTDDRYTVRAWLPSGERAAERTAQP